MLLLSFPVLPPFQLRERYIYTYLTLPQTVWPFTNGKDPCVQNENQDTEYMVPKLNTFLSFAPVQLACMLTKQFMFE